MDLDDGMVEYFREMADVLVERCGVSRAEAAAVFGCGQRR